MLSAPLRDRFGMVDKLEFYTHDDLREIVMRSAEVLGVDIDEEVHLRSQEDQEVHRDLRTDFSSAAGIMLRCVMTAI